MAGRVAGGVVLAEPASPSYVRWALDQAGRPGDLLDRYQRRGVDDVIRLAAR